MTWWGMTLISIVLVALPLTLWLKRAGEEEWARHQQAHALDRFTAAVAALGFEMTKMQRSFLVMAHAAREAGKKIELNFRRGS